MFVIPYTFHNKFAYIFSLGAIYNLEKINMYRVGGYYLFPVYRWENDMERMRVICVNLPKKLEDGVRSRVEICVFN